MYEKPKYKFAKHATMYIRSLLSHANALLIVLCEFALIFFAYNFGEHYKIYVII